MEPIEQWRKEFESGKSAQAIQRDYRNPEKYWNDPMQYWWEGFLLAKRSRPVVELPKIGMCFGKAPFSYFLADQTVEALTAAGIQYRIKGE